jgi:hypothetical protein
MPAIEVSTEVPYSILARVIGDNGILQICTDRYVIHPVDSLSARWISATLVRLGHRAPEANHEGKDEGDTH